LTQEKIEQLNDINKMDSMFSGTTVVTVFMYNNTLVCANLGDSRAIMCSTNLAEVWYCTPLSRDHKPEEPDEANRVRKSNGRIE
jgi:serine/threonine protein phosphatase PrpC